MGHCKTVNVSIDLAGEKRLVTLTSALTRSVYDGNNERTYSFACHNRHNDEWLVSYANAVRGVLMRCAADEWTFRKILDGTAATIPHDVRARIGADGDVWIVAMRIYTGASRTAVLCQGLWL